MSARACDQTESGSPSRYLTPAQVAELLQVSEKTGSRWALTDPSHASPHPRIKRLLDAPSDREDAAAERMPLRAEARPVGEVYDSLSHMASPARVGGNHVCRYDLSPPWICGLFLAGVPESWVLP